MHPDSIVGLVKQQTVRDGAGSNDAAVSGIDAAALGPSMDATAESEQTRHSNPLAQQRRIHDGSPLTSHAKLQVEGSAEGGKRVSDHGGDEGNHEASEDREEKTSRHESSRDQELSLIHI